MYTSIAYAGLLLLTLSFALAKGTRSERTTGIVLLLGNLATIAVMVVNPGDFVSVSTAYLAVDVLATIVLTILAVRRPSWMSILVAAFQLNGSLGHLVKLLAPETISLSYAVLLRIWGWPMILALLAARFWPTLCEVIRQSDLHSVPRPFRPALLASSRVVPGSGDGLAARRGERTANDRDLPPSSSAPPPIVQES